MSTTKRTAYILILTVIFCIAVYCSAFAGYHDNGLHLLKKLFNLDGDTESILLEILRLPRVLRGIIAGCCLAVSGMLLQSVSKNPLAEPYITGISSGAGFGIVLSVLFFGGTAYSLFGFTGALISALFVILFCGFGRFSITKLILVGLSVNMFAGAVISFLILKNTDKAYSLMYILTGNITENTGISDLHLILLFLCTVFLCGLFVPKLNFLRLDTGLTHNEKRKENYDITVIILSAFLAALSVLTAGILSFVGIVAPQISKLLFGNDYRWLFFSNILIGSAFILFADFISRIILYPVQIPLGLVIAFIGSPIFIYFLTRKGDFLHD
ncbi:MAG: iron ABC transporter permease [Candidatus Gastranaerophilales bacterium]|nr:iron ABC transporter permease [Candidatus Gastranaerophilales bacterium]